MITKDCKQLNYVENAERLLKELKPLPLYINRSTNARCIVSSYSGIGTWIVFNLCSRLCLCVCVCFNFVENEKGRRRNINERVKHRWVASHTHPNQGLNPQTFDVKDDAETNSHPTRTISGFLKIQCIKFWIPN